MIRTPHRSRTRLAALAAAACFLAFGGLAPAAQREDGPTMDVVPNVYGDGILFAYSGLDGKTSWAHPLVASTLDGGLGIRIHLPKDPMIKIYLPGGQERNLDLRAATGDLIVGDLPGDPFPLVIGMAGPNLIAGRVPAGGRVSFQGGGSECVLLRKAVGDRTQFALAYSPEGGQVAAREAAQGLKVSIDTLAESRMGFYRGLPGPRLDADRKLKPTLAKAWGVLKVNSYAPEGRIETRWTTPDRWPHRDMWLWDSAFHALGLMHLDVALAKDALRAVWGFQDASGFLPHQMSPTSASQITQPPVLAWAAWQVFEADEFRDRAFLEQAFDVSRKHVLWLFHNRRLDGPVPPEKPVEHGDPLFVWKDGNESGADNAPRFDGGADFAAVDFSAYMVRECRTLQLMAQRLKFGELAKTWGLRADRCAEAARKHLWDPERKFFFDRKGPGGEWIDVWSVSGLLPIWAGIADTEQTEALVGHLTNPEKFWTAMPVPSVARDDPAFKKDMWRGPTWINMNYLLIRGLQERGRDRDAEALRRRTLAGVHMWYMRTGVLYEFYDPDGDIYPADLDRKNRLQAGVGLPVIADYGWTAALTADLLVRPAP